MFDGTAYDATYVPVASRVKLTRVAPAIGAKSGAAKTRAVRIPRSKTYVVTFTLSPNSAAGRSTRTMTSTAFVRARAPGPAPIVNRRNAAVTKTPSRTGDPCLARPSHGQKVMVGIRTYCTPLTDCRVRVGHGVPDDARCSPIV